MVLPFLYMLSTSFKGQQYVLTMPPQWLPHPATVSNYTTAWNSDHFPRYFLNSVVVAVVTTVLSLLLSSMMAYAFARFDFPGREAMFRILLLGLMIPAMMLIIPQFILAKYLHLLDSLTGLVVFYVAASLSLNTFLLRGFFEAIPAELEQAMEVDGAGSITRYWRLILPLAASGPGHRHHLHVPRQLGRVSVGADDHQHSVEADAAARHRLVPRPELDAVGPRVRRVHRRDRCR